MLYANYVLKYLALQICFYEWIFVCYCQLIHSSENKMNQKCIYITFSYSQVLGTAPYLQHYFRS